MAQEPKKDKDVGRFEVVRRRRQHPRAPDDVPRVCVVVEVTYGFDMSFPEDVLGEALLAAGAHLVGLERLNDGDGYRAKLFVVAELRSVQAAYDGIDSFFDCLNLENEIDRQPERALVLILDMSKKAVGGRRLEVLRTHCVCVMRAIDHVLHGPEFMEREERMQLEQARDIELKKIKAIDDATEGRFA